MAELIISRSSKSRDAVNIMPYLKRNTQCTEKSRLGGVRNSRDSRGVNS